MEMVCMLLDFRPSSPYITKRNCSTEVPEPPVSQHYMDRNVPEGARKSNQHVSESGAATVMSWGLPVNKNNLRNSTAPIQLYHFPSFWLVPRSLH